MVFSSLFDTGAQVSCIRYDTVAALGLLGQISDNKINVRTANGQDMDVKGSVVVNFKIEPSSFTYKFVVWEGLTRPFILGKEFLSHHCFTLGWTDNNKRSIEYRNKVIAVASQAVIDGRIMVSCPIKIPLRNIAMVPTNCPNLFSSRLEACSCPELKNRFPNLYLEPIQYDNSDGKWQDVIPYMIINLDYDSDIYISKDTAMAYVHEEDKSCEYLVIESTGIQKLVS